MRKKTYFAGLAALLAGAGMACADSFGGGAFTMDFADISGGTVADDTGYGAVANDYRMGVPEVSRTMVDSYNTLSGGPTITLQDMTSWGGNGPNRPATGVSWNEAARFMNWLNTSSGSVAAYKFTTGCGNDNIELWTAGDAGYDPDNPFRNSGARYFLPSEDEWYRAAYYDPSASVYYDYATGSDTAPTAVASGTGSGTAVYDQLWSAGPADITNAGGLSPFGTMGQNGNVWEWGESGSTPPNDSADESRVARGGAWYSDSSYLQSSSRYSYSPTFENNAGLGFRVAAVPEPSGLSLMVIGALGLLLKRKRR